jgi:hypothetical protein
MSKIPPVPHDQQSDKIRGRSSPASRDAEVSRDPARGNAGLNLEEQGRYGNAKQNLTPQWKVQNR